MTKRTFFKSLMSMVATVALAPEIAFGRKLGLGEASHELTLDEMPSHTHINPAWKDAPYEAAFIYDPKAHIGDCKWRYLP